MPRDSFTEFMIPPARTLAGFVSAVLLAFIGDLTGRVFNLTVGYPWDQVVHQNIHFISIGVGAGIGAYLGWMILNRRWYFILGSAVLVLLGGVVGVYLGRIYGPGVDPTYWWSRYAIDTTVHLAGAGLSTVVATALGLLDLIYTRARLRTRVRQIPPGDRSMIRPSHSP